MDRHARTSTSIVREHRLANVTMTPRIPLSELPRRIAAATVCSGIFGSSSKATRVVPSKVYQCMGMRRAVITMASRAVEEHVSRGRRDCHHTRRRRRRRSHSRFALCWKTRVPESASRGVEPASPGDFTPTPIARRFLSHCQEVRAR